MKSLSPGPLAYRTWTLGTVSLPLPVVIVVDGGAIACEVEEDARPGQLGQVLGLEVALQTAEGEPAHASDVHPGAEGGKRVWISQLRQRFL